MAQRDTTDVGATSAGAEAFLAQRFSQMQNEFRSLREYICNELNYAEMNTSLSLLRCGSSLTDSMLLNPVDAGCEESSSGFQTNLRDESPAHLACKRMRNSQSNTSAVYAFDVISSCVDELRSTVQHAMTSFRSKLSNYSQFRFVTAASDVDANANSRRKRKHDDKSESAAGISQSFPEKPDVAKDSEVSEVIEAPSNEEAQERASTSRLARSTRHLSWSPNGTPNAVPDKPKQNIERCFYSFTCSSFASCLPELKIRCKKRVEVEAIAASRPRLCDFPPTSFDQLDGLAAMIFTGEKEMAVTMARRLVSLEGSAQYNGFYVTTLPYNQWSCNVCVLSNEWIAIGMYPNKVMFIEPNSGAKNCILFGNPKGASTVYVIRKDKDSIFAFRSDQRLVFEIGASIRPGGRGLPIVSVNVKRAYKFSFVSELQRVAYDPVLEMAICTKSSALKSDDRVVLLDKSFKQLCTLSVPSKPWREPTCCALVAWNCHGIAVVQDPLMCDIVAFNLRGQFLGSVICETVSKADKELLTNFYEWAVSLVDHSKYHSQILITVLSLSPNSKSFDLCTDVGVASQTSNSGATQSTDSSKLAADNR